LAGRQYNLIERVDIKVKKVLVLEDETSIRSFIVINLNRAGYEVIEAGTGAEAFEQLRLHPDIKVAILDIMLPDTDGFEVCRKIRTVDQDIGIVMLTARATELDELSGRSAGADQYVTKPFSPPVLTTIIDRLFKRIGADDQTEIVTGEIVQGPFKLNTITRVLEKDGVHTRLTPKECLLMEMFMDNPGKALSREYIIKKVWGADDYGDEKKVDVHIKRLRTKIDRMDNIESDSSTHKYIVNEWGYGYRLGL